MTIVPGKVVNGRVEVEDVELPEGAEVSVYLHGADSDELSPEQLAEVDEAIAEADRGEGVPAEQVLSELRMMRDAEVARRH